MKKKNYQSYKQYKCQNKIINSKRKYNTFILHYIKLMWNAMFMVYLFLHDFHEHHVVWVVHSPRTGNLKLYKTLIFTSLKTTKISNTNRHRHQHHNLDNHNCNYSPDYIQYIDCNNHILD